MLKVTIITICYNERERLKKTIESVCCQDYKDIEYLIIDGASTDGTHEMIQSYLGCHDIYFYSEKDHGIYNAMNRGIARANGDYIYFMNAGDSFYNAHVISEIVSCIGEEKETIYYGRVCRIYPDGLRQIEDFSKYCISLKEIMANGSMPCHQSIFSPRRALTNHYFREQFKIRADYEWLMYSITHGWDYKEISTLIGFYDMSGMSGRIKNMKLLKKEEMEILKEYAPILSKEASIYSKSNVEELKTEILKYTSLFHLMNYWLVLKQKNLSIEKLLKQKGYKRIAIYGISHIGKTLFEELKKGNIIIDYAIDRNVDSHQIDIKVVLPEEALDKVDVIIVTALDSYYEIEKMLNQKINCPILSFEDLLYEMENITY